MPRYLLSVKIVWLIVAMTSLNVVPAFLPDSSFPSRSQNATLVPAQLTLDDSPLGEVASTASEGRNLWEIQQQSKQTLALARSCKLVSLALQRENLLRSAPVPVLLPVRMWFPRKLSPPSAQDEPFLS
jgi:hypothetical protein